MKLFIWKCLRNIIPTNIKLHTYNQTVDTICPRCLQADETLTHLLLQCDHSRAIWSAMNINVSALIIQNIEAVEWITSWFQDSANSSLVEYNTWIYTLMVTAWFIWKNRCSKVFQNKNQNIYSTVHSIKWMLQHFV